MGPSTGTSTTSFARREAGGAAGFDRRPDAAFDPEPDQLEETLAAVSEPGLEISSGSSLRALTAVSRKKPAGAEEQAKALLSAAGCLLEDDLRQMQASLSRAKRERAVAGERAVAARRLGAWAHVLAEARTLSGAVDRALAARGHALEPDACDAPAQRSWWVALRGLVGPAALSAGQVDAYARGLVRLRAELEQRAGLRPAS